MITVTNLSKSFGSKLLFENVTVSFSPGNRYGLTGPNGAGKSTFLKILQGEEEPSSGTVSIPKRTGILRQNQFAYDEYRILDTVLMGNATLWEAMQEREKLWNATDFTDEMGLRLAELESIVAEENGYEAEQEAEQLLEGIGIPAKKHTDLMKTLPTDLKFRILLAQALFGNPEALLLDEPTNYLDLSSVQWLEEKLIGYKGTLIVISHDRHFLNTVCTHIADIDYDTIIIYPGNYDDMVAMKVQARAKIEAENREKAKKIAQLQDFVARFGAGTRASQVQSRKKEIERLELTELKKSNIQRPYIRFDIKRQSGREVLTATQLNKSYLQPDGSLLHVIKNFNLSVGRGEHIGIIGNNGVGKTTLLRMLAGDLTPDSGTVTYGHEVSLGYFPQDYKDGIQRGTTAYKWLESFSTPDEGTEVISGLLGRMLFSGEARMKLTDNLSGGESARLLIAKLMLQKHNLLILDEPTNHLDLESVSALAEGLEKYQGTALVVSHDRDLISRFATRIIELTYTEIFDYTGTFDEFLEWKKQRTRVTTT
ncbi:MAG: ATP-binding cassette domain-containing protein [Bacteroidota bacterium]|nr:ATP-binding cassette domain-containing protein [Candidatus Kapabacteria bacterium]MDW8220155.1 ATP-binding cassette domain-containing protein [Bacteroidota bacterium]